MRIHRGAYYPNDPFIRTVQASENNRRDKLVMIFLI